VFELLQFPEGAGQGVAGAFLLGVDDDDVGLGRALAQFPAVQIGPQHHGGVGVVAGAVLFDLGLGLEHGDAHFGGGPAGGDLGQTLLQRLDLIAGDPDQRLGPGGHMITLPSMS